MSEFDLWAPRASTAALVTDEGRQQMRPLGNGWWTPTTEPTGDYGYVLEDDEQVLPDPRSRRQPYGVHGLSRAFDPAHHEWTDGDWTGRELEGGVIYELHVGTFTPAGTLDSAIEKLDYLVDLGIDFVEVLPVNGFNGTHNWGYDGVLWYAVQETYGGPAAYQRFVDACHARGLAVIQDVVYNHLGPSGNYLPRFGPYISEETNTWGSSINLDGEGSPAVREYIIQNALMWLGDYHVDGLRLDAVHALLDRGEAHLLLELSTRVDELATQRGVPLTLIAESDLNDPVMITPRPRGYGLTAQWSDDYHHAVHVALTGETSGYYADFEGLDVLAKAMSRSFVHDGTYSSFRERDHGVPIDLATTPTWRLVTYSQDHDQVGNRATGDRLTASLTHDQLALAAALTILTPFTPMIFMGEEWGATTPWQFFTSHPEPELGEATAAGRIAEFAAMGWDPSVVPDPQDPATFEASKLDWGQLGQPQHADLLQTYRELIAVRRRHPGLTDPSFETINCTWDAVAGWLRMDRPGVSVLFDFANARYEVTTNLSSP